MKKKLNIISEKIIKDFGSEWQFFDQSKMPYDEKIKVFNQYFSIFPWHLISKNSVGFDAGCGSGRWAEIMIKKVRHLHCIEPSQAINVAKKNLTEFNNCTFYNQKIENMNLNDESMDFGYCLGVLHHIEDSQLALNICVKKIKKNAPFLVYVYYSIDNRSFFFILFKLVNFFRFFISRMPFKLKLFITNLISLFVYLPIARFCKILNYFNIPINFIPLNFYYDKSFYTMRTDSLDRFGTKYEKRYSKKDIQTLLEKAGLSKIIFSNERPFWCVLGYKL